MEFLPFIVGLLFEYKLVAVFIGAMFLGELMIVPVLYFSIAGYFNVPTVFVLMVVASFVTDLFWFVLGRVVSREKLLKLPFMHFLHPTMDRLHGFFDTHGEKCVFYSRFIFGTRIATELLSGLHDMSLWKFIRADMLAILLWMLALFVLALGIYTGTSILIEAGAYTHIGFMFFAFVAIFLTYVVQRLLKRRVFQE